MSDCGSLFPNIQKTSDGLLFWSHGSGPQRQGPETSIKVSAKGHMVKQDTFIY